MMKVKEINHYRPPFPQYGDMEDGVVYPGEVEVVVEVVNEKTVCSDLTAADTSCNVTLPRGVYNISISQSNDIGSTAVRYTLDSKCVIL